MRARFCPYWPNSIDASRLSSNARTTWVSASVPLGVSAAISDDPSLVSRFRKDSVSRTDERRLGALRVRRTIGELAEQAVRSDAGDGHGRDLTEQSFRTHDLYRLQIGRTADDLPGEPTRLVEQHVKGAADAAGIECNPVSFYRLLQPLEPLGLDRLVDLIATFGGRRAGSRRIFEREGACIGDLVDDAQGLVEILFGLAGEADNKIGREGHVGANGAQAVDDREIVGARMPAVHGTENPIGAGLHRQMQLRHQGRQVAMGRDEVVVDVAWMTGRVAQARDARNLGESEEQSSERPRPPVGSDAMIGVDVLPDERDLAHSAVGEMLRLGDDLRRRARDFGAARVGHDAEGAELVAALLHGQERRRAARAGRFARRRRKMIELVLGRKIRVHDVAMALRTSQQLGQAMIVLRAEDEIDERRAADDLLALGLGHTSGDRDHHAAAFARRAVLELADAAKLRIDLLRRLLADVAG